ncbi:TatD family hydrolase [Glaciecola petra]|uniref:TatD family hydrolase n=1 Tax=Glaciecola petra TaxID=3075602 RepID=A0ABU2ZV72_9ALTE|nr:TatD family hydrolase [Aestuariibacter sp. P117]MDT0595489.1 TatD family hydrolase [Aestuariibacter sp. P117]
MAWCDAGVNLFDSRFDKLEVLNGSLAHDVTHLLIISSDIAESTEAERFCAHSTQACKTAFTAGVHPHYADAVNGDSWTKLTRVIADKQLAAIGECGLDFNRNFSSQNNQRYVFEKQLELAAEHQVGIYLHEREAFDEQVNLLQRYTPYIPFMVAHCFTGNKSQLQTYIELGCYIGITGWVCDPKRGNDLREAITALPKEKMLLETDSPFLFPKTLKPRRSVNVPANLPHIAQQVSLLTDYSLSEIQTATFANACRLFFDKGE